MKKKEQFNLALWDRLKQNNIPHSFETMDGKEVTQVVFFNCTDIQPIFGVFNKELESWDDFGFYNEDAPNSNNLFIVWEEEQLKDSVFKAYMAIMPYEGAAMTFSTLELAQNIVGATAIAITPISIPYTKGEGLNNG